MSVKPDGGPAQSPAESRPMAGGIHVLGGTVEFGESSFAIGMLFNGTHVRGLTSGAKARENVVRCLFFNCTFEDGQVPLLGGGNLITDASRGETQP